MEALTTLSKELLFTLSKDHGDFIIQPFRGSGNGGQKKNKPFSACRISHPASGAVSECQEERSFEQNKRKAFKRLLEKPEFKRWHRLEVMKQTGQYALIEEQVERDMKYIKVEHLVNGVWKEGEL